MNFNGTSKKYEPPKDKKKSFGYIRGTTPNKLPDIPLFNKFSICSINSDEYDLDRKFYIPLQDGIKVKWSGVYSIVAYISCSIKTKGRYSMTILKNNERDFTHIQQLQNQEGDNSVLTMSITDSFYLKSGDTIKIGLSARDRIDKDSKLDYWCINIMSMVS